MVGRRRPLELIGAVVGRGHAVRPPIGFRGKVDSTARNPIGCARTSPERVLHVVGGDVARIAALLPASAPSELALDGDLYDELGGLVAGAVEVGKAGGQHPVVLLTGADGAGRKRPIRVADS